MNISKATPRQRWFIAGCILVLLLALHMQWLNARGGDRDWLLVFSHSWVEGKHLYSDLFHPNPPLIIWYFGGVIWLAERLGCDDTHLLLLVTLGGVAVCCYLCDALLRQHPEWGKRVFHRVQHVLLLVFIFVVWAVPSSFGDRDYILWLCLTPYMLRWMPTLEFVSFSLPLRIGIALFAAFALCMKPHAVLLLATVNSLSILRNRSLAIVWSLENIILVLAGALYVWAIWCFTTEYFSVVLPILRDTYRVVRDEFRPILLYSSSVFMLALTMCEFRLRYQTPYRRDILYLLGLCGGATAYAMSNNGWGYTFYPLQSSILLLTGWVYQEFEWLKITPVAGGGSARSLVFGSRACAANLMGNTLIVVVVCLLSYTSGLGKLVDNTGQQTTLLQKMEAEVREHKAKSFGFISPNLSGWYQITHETGARLETRFNSLWMLVKMVLADEDFRRSHQWIYAYVANAYAEDMNRNKPDMMIVDISDEFYTTKKYLDVLKEFSVYPAFADAWRAYHLSKTLGDCKPEGEKRPPYKAVCKYGIYVRDPR